MAERVVVIVNAGALPPSADPTQVGELQRSIDGGATWEPVRGAQALELGDVGTYATAYDYEVPRGASVSYRARTTATVGGEPVTSDWSTVTVEVYMPKGDECVWLKSGTDPSYNVSVDLVSQAVESSSDEEQAVFQPRGRSTPIVHSIGTTGEDFGVQPLFFTSDEAWEAFEALRLRREPVLMQLPYGDGELWEQRWVRFGKRSVTRLTTTTMKEQQLRSVTVAVREVATPPVS